MNIWDQTGETGNELCIYGTGTGSLVADFGCPPGVQTCIDGWQGDVKSFYPPIDYGGNFANYYTSCYSYWAGNTGPFDADSCSQTADHVTIDNGIH